VDYFEPVAADLLEARRERAAMAFGGFGFKTQQTGAAGVSD